MAFWGTVLLLHWRYWHDKFVCNTYVARNFYSENFWKKIRLEQIRSFHIIKSKLTVFLDLKSYVKELKTAQRVQQTIWWRWTTLSFLGCTFLLAMFTTNYGKLSYTLCIRIYCIIQMKLANHTWRKHLGNSALFWLLKIICHLQQLNTTLMDFAI